ncbi:MAG: endonuclease [Winogradskyella sp.]|nr:endonuclease [Winogradskyella sp.]NNF85149.1 endonuclease [Winogradskyella sp.]NNL82411.1 endonuclease [Winogradskyella sp.]
MERPNKNQSITIAFYNVENLFDTFNDSATNDDDFLPGSAKRWTKKRYANKLYKLSSVIKKIGDGESADHPVIIGLAEVENKHVLNDLVAHDNLTACNYQYVHFDSSDERGIDVALLYDYTQFQVTHSETFSVYLEDEQGNRDYTRDILLVTGMLYNEKVSFIVNHWSSRREGEKATESKRLRASGRVNYIIENLKADDPDSQIIVMGDFNDNPSDTSIENMVTHSMLFNPFKTVLSRQKGSLNHSFQWNLFDQILLSTNFLDSTNTKFSLSHADVFNDKWVTQYRGKYKGQPFRTYVGKKYHGGYSDHFPVYIQLIVK